MVLLQLHAVESMLVVIVACNGQIDVYRQSKAQADLISSVAGH